MAEPKIINFDDINYAIYKIGDWENHYEINQIGLSNEIPVTNATLHHVKLSMSEIRKSEFEIDDKKVNGFVAIALQLNPKVKEMDLEEVIALEQKEYKNILKELGNLELLSDDDHISLDNEEYLIFKLEKECHVTNSIPANTYTKKYFLEQLNEIKENLS